MRKLFKWLSLLSKTTQLGIIGLILGGILPASILYILGFESSLTYTLRWFKMSAVYDSWMPIRKAVVYILSNEPQSLYNEIYYKEWFQFIYSPLSLIVFRWINWHNFNALNYFSWWVVVATAIINGILFIKIHQMMNNGKYLLSKIEEIIQIGIAIIATLLFYPITRGYYLGQIQTWINFLLLVSLLLWIYGKKFACGFILGLISIVKPHLSLILIWGIVRSQYILIFGFLSVVIPIGMASIWNFGMPIHIEYLKLMKFLSSRGESFFANQSVNGLLNRLLFTGPNLEWDGTHTLIHYNLFVHIATTITSLIAISFSIFWQKFSKLNSEFIDFCIALLTFTIASPVAYEHHYGFMVPLFWIVLLYLRENLLWLLISFTLCANLFSPTDFFAESYLNFVQSYLFFGALIILILLYKSNRTLKI